MRAMIFAAGLGSRFKPWTDSHPKALAVVNGKSLLQRNIEYLQQYGIKDVETSIIQITWRIFGLWLLDDTYIVVVRILLNNTVL